MHNIKFFVTLIIILTLAGCSTIETRKSVPDLQTITMGNNYRVRVKTGNLALDRIIYNSANTIFSKYLPVLEGLEYTGFIEVVFASALSQSKSAYKTNVLYGDKWYTGSNADNIHFPDEDEIARRSFLTWQNSKMTVSIKDIKGNTLWIANYQYKGGEDFNEIFAGTADVAAKLCLDRIVSKFRQDFNIKSSQVAEKQKKKLPTIALIIKSGWTETGKNSHGHIVFVNTRSLSHPSSDTIRVWTKASSNNNFFMDQVEIHCKDNKFRLLESRLDKNPSLSPHTDKWSAIAPKSTPELIYNSFCHK